jgi:hypothetical protein
MSLAAAAAARRTLDSHADLGLASRQPALEDDPAGTKGSETEHRDDVEHGLRPQSATDR